MFQAQLEEALGESPTAEPDHRYRGQRLPHLACQNPRRTTGKADL